MGFTLQRTLLKALQTLLQKLLVHLKELACSKVNGLICGLCSNYARMARGVKESKSSRKSLPSLEREEIEKLKIQTHSMDSKAALAKRT
jgi:hypothetical protein